MITLAYEKRATDNANKSEALRKNGKIPAVFYGPKEKSTPIVLSYADFIKAWKKAGESSVIVLKETSAIASAGKVASAHEGHEALIYDVDLHPVTGAPRHADFYVIEKGKKVKVHVQLSFDGVAPAVKDLGGILVKVLREVEIEAAPKDLPHDVRVDISALKEMTSVIHAKDIALPAGVTLVSRADEIVASIAQAVEEVEETPIAVDMSAIEVEKKGKEAKEGIEGEAADAVAGSAGGSAGKSGGEKKPETKK
jgi:large subunit ribosomal protein L25